MTTSKHLGRGVTALAAIVLVVGRVQLRFGIVRAGQRGRQHGAQRGRI